MVPTHYDYRLVAVSISIAICAAYAALGLAERVADAKCEFRLLWVGGGACAMGTAIWSMHYIGMLAFQLPVPVHYDISLVLLSMVAAILASAVALVFTSRVASERRHLAVAALAMGAGIVTMHYIGMAAMRMQCRCTYDWRIVALSIVIAVVVSGVALMSFRYRAKVSRMQKLAAATLLGLAICSMHYTGMAAAHFTWSNQPLDFSGTASVNWLGGIAIAAGTLLVLGLAMATAFADRHFSAQSRRLESTEERYRLLFERSLAGICRARLDGTIIDMNDACMELLGYDSRSEVIGKIIRNLHASGDSHERRRELLLETGRLPAREVRIRRTDGSEVWVMASATLLKPQDGTAPEVQAMLLSIEDLKRTERELRSAKHAADSANMAKSQFLANMSHELRTPLNGVLGMAEVLMLGDLSEDQLECVDLVKSSADSLLGVIDDILKFSTDATTQGADRTEKFNLRELLETEIEAASAASRDKSLRLQYTVDPNVRAQYWGKPRWIRQAVSGLMNNAIKFTPAGEVKLTAKAEDTSAGHQRLRITVRDTGIGIPADQHAAIFEPFNQVDNSNSRRFGGTGLGLAIVRNLIQAMDGDISLESNADGGCTFKVVISMATQPEGSMPSLVSEQAEAGIPWEPPVTVQCQPCSKMPAGLAALS